MAVAVTTEPEFHVSKPRLLLDGSFPASDVTADGKRFVVVLNEDEQERPPARVVLSWRTELQQLVPRPGGDAP